MRTDARLPRFERLAPATARHAGGGRARPGGRRLSPTDLPPLPLAIMMARLTLVLVLFTCAIAVALNLLPDIPGGVRHAAARLDRPEGAVLATAGSTGMGHPGPQTTMDVSHE